MTRNENWIYLKNMTWNKNLIYLKNIKGYLFICYIILFKTFKQNNCHAKILRNPNNLRCYKIIASVCIWHIWNFSNRIAFIRAN